MHIHNISYTSISACLLIKFSPTIAPCHVPQTFSVLHIYFAYLLSYFSVCVAMDNWLLCPSQFGAGGGVLETWLKTFDKIFFLLGFGSSLELHLQWAMLTQSTTVVTTSTESAAKWNTYTRNTHTHTFFCDTTQPGPKPPQCRSF
jgi:hypothetical protein